MLPNSMCLALQQFAGQYGKQEIKLALKIKWLNILLKCCVMHVLLCDTGQGYTWRWIERCWRSRHNARPGKTGAAEGSTKGRQRRGRTTKAWRASKVLCAFWWKLHMCNKVVDHFRAVVWVGCLLYTVALHLARSLNQKPGPDVAESCVHSPFLLCLLLLNNRVKKKSYKDCWSFALPTAKLRLPLG